MEGCRVSHLLVIDIGSSQIIAAVAEIMRTVASLSEVSVAHVGGLKQGVVIQLIQWSMHSSVRWLKQSNGRDQTHGSTGICGWIAHSGTRHFRDGDSESSRGDRYLVDPSDGTSAGPGANTEREILSVIPRSFTLNGQPVFAYPTG